jgi:hypothetical protein
MRDLWLFALQAIKEECEGILSNALPALEAAVAALNTIKPADIKLVSSFKNPPAAVKVVLEAVCVMLDVKPALVVDPDVPGKKNQDYWPSSKSLLGDAKFVERLKAFDRDHIDAKSIEKVRTLAMCPTDSITVPSVWKCLAFGSAKRLEVPIWWFVRGVVLDSSLQKHILFEIE